MNQTITISPEIVKYLVEHPPAYEEISNAQKIVRLIRENKLASDASGELRKRCFEELANSDDRRRAELTSLINGWFEYNFKRIDVQFDELYQFAISTEDKIVLDPLLNHINIRKYEKQGLEAHNDATFIEPEIHHRLKHSSAILRFENGKSYELEKILHPYLRATNHIRIEDPYLPNPKARNNLKKLIESIGYRHYQLTYLSERDYCNLSEDDYCNNDDHRKNNTRKNNTCKNYSSLKKYLSALSSNSYEINSFFYSRKTHKERYIFTDQVRISLPGGLDFLDTEGKIKDSEEFLEVRVDPIETINR